MSISFSYRKVDEVLRHRLDTPHASRRRLYEYWQYPTERIVFTGKNLERFTLLCRHERRQSNVL